MIRTIKIIGCALKNTLLDLFESDVIQGITFMALLILYLTIGITLNHSGLSYLNNHGYIVLNQVWLKNNEEKLTVVSFILCIVEPIILLALSVVISLFRANVKECSRKISK